MEKIRKHENLKYSPDTKYTEKRIEFDRIYRTTRISHGALRERREKEVGVESLKNPAKRVT
jgi:hypothetical protein